jgi:iron complex outermembrane receptor protein
MFLLTILMAVSLQLNEVNVTGHRSDVESGGMRLVTTLTAEEVALLPVKTVADVLQYIPGVDVRQRGASGVQMDPSIRGGSAKQVKVLLNGIDMTDPQTEHYTMDMPIDALVIERIEVLQGTNYSVDAFSGAINIVTKSKVESQQSTVYSGQMTVGEYGLVNPGLAVKAHKGDWYLNSSASYNRSEGYVHNTDYQIVNAFVQTGYKGLDFQAGAQMKDAGANCFYTTKYPEQFDATRTAFGSIAYQHRWQSGWAIHANAYYRAHYDRYELFRGTPLNKHWTHTSGAHIEGGWSNDWSKTTAGVEVRDEYIRSSNIGIHNRIQVRYFAEQRFYWRGLSAAVGGAGIWNSQFGHDWSVGANLGYEPIQGLHLFANVNRAIRVPTFTDLYYHSATQQADPLTKPEKALQVELSVQYSKGHWYASAAGYYRWGRDIIDWIKEPDPSVVVWRSTNNSKVNAAGMEATVGVQGYEWIKRIELSYAFCDVKADAGTMMSLYVLDYLRHKATIRIEHKIYKGFGASWSLSFRQREGEYTSLEGTIEHYRPVWLLDGSVYWHNQFVKVSVDAKNIANQLYYDFSGVVQPRHWISATVQFSL